MTNQLKALQMRLAAPFGFYGAGNVGDEATLLGFGCLIKRFGNSVEVNVASSCVNQANKVEPFFHYYPYTDGIMGWEPKLQAHLASGYVFAGGTPISDSLGDWPLRTVGGILEHAHHWGKPTAFVGIGVEHLFNEISRTRMQEQIVPNALAWSVRSEKDRDRLLEVGVAEQDVAVAADMAWLLDPVDGAYGRQVFEKLGLSDRPVIGVNVNAEPHLVEKSPQLFDELAAALDDLIARHGVQVLFLFAEIREGETYDQAASETVRQLMTHKEHAIMGPREYLIPQQMMSIISQCATTISTRYHFCLFSALQGTPFLAISRSDKVTDFCSDMDWKAEIDPAHVSRELIIADVEEQLGGFAEEMALLPEKIAMMRRRAEENRFVLEKLAKATSDIGPKTWLRHAAGRVGQKMGFGG
jgi:polysaccharide pyruvyl transferase WcaK-like protein